MDPDWNQARKLTFQKNFKLKNKSDFDFVREHGRRFTDAFYTLLAVSGAESGLAGFKFGIICSRRFHKNAVVRNRARRLVSESVRLLKPRIAPCRIIVIPRRGIYRANMQEVRSRLERSLKHAGVLTISPL